MTIPRTPTAPAPAATAPVPHVPAAPRRSSVHTLLGSARHGVAEAALTTAPAERYATAHLAALRAAAAVLAARARPVPTTRRGRPLSAWLLLATVAPELTEWAQFFAAGAAKRAAAEAGKPSAVSAREADDLLRDVETFLAVVETTVGVPHQPALPRTG